MIQPAQKRGDSFESCKTHCDNLKSYWSTQGYSVKAYPEIVKVVRHPKEFYYIVASNLVNGAPKEYKYPVPT